MALNSKGGKIEKLEKDLYSREAPQISGFEREPLKPQRKGNSAGWSENEDLAKELATEYSEPKKTSFFTKVFIASIIFFVVAAGIAAYILLGGFNVISSKNVDILVEGPIAAAAGEELVLDITVSNNNNVLLEQVELFVEYPEGTRMSEDLTKELVRDKILFDDIPSGKTGTKTIKAVLFGEKDSAKDIKMTLDYKARGANASFSKQKTYSIVIKSSPILMEVAYPKEVNAGQEITFTLNITSNSAALVRNLILRAEYPFGFSFTGSVPKTSSDNNVWRVGDLNPKEKRTIVIKGKIEGQNEEERTFRFNTGIAKENDENQIGVDFISLSQSILIKKPFIDLAVKLNQSNEKEYFTKIGEHVRGEISWSNSLPITINDIEVLVKLSGSALDRNTVRPSRGGFYRSADNTITWDKNSLPELRSIGPNDTNSVGFEFSSIPSSQNLIATGRNLEMNANISVKGTRITEDGVSQTVTTSFDRKVKILTNLSLNGRTLYSTGPFRNTGPVPPKAEVPTSYTIVWTLSNTFNDVTGASVSATLPPYVKWLNVFSPTNSNIVYNAENRTIVWNSGEVKAGSGFSSPAQEVSFQISLEPSLSQVGTVPALVENIQFTGTDRFTGKVIGESKLPLTTRASTDPTYNIGNETVVR